MWSLYLLCIVYIIRRQ
ncbi:hypothetical protein DRF65_07015 [Chryseobacterium pennae]|uniref:Uncharacterized protein n=1 Tax=Chryseobacterium pennae TaxID=2258962 RepID=A0A3D9CB98_9FLAO|nr:hypothetical protein DRF65_07015 [Chryseobacterium pennae]